MFKKKNKTDIDQVTFDDLINDGLEMLNTSDVFSEEFASGIDNLEKVVRTKTEMSKNTPSWDTVVAAGTNILGLLLVLNFEKVGIVTSKAFGLVGKLKF